MVRIAFLGDGIFVDRLKKTRPAAPGVVFRLGTEERRVAADTVIGPGRLLVPVAPAEGAFRSGATRHLEFLFTQLLAPFALAAPGLLSM